MVGERKKVAAGTDPRRCPISPPACCCCCCSRSLLRTGSIAVWGMPGRTDMVPPYDGPGIGEPMEPIPPMGMLRPGGTPGRYRTHTNMFKEDILQANYKQEQAVPALSAHFLLGLFVDFTPHSNSFWNKAAGVNSKCTSGVLWDGVETVHGCYNQIN